MSRVGSKGWLLAALLLLAAPRVAHAVDADGDGWSIRAGDCDDADPLRNPGMADDCNGIDDDCDGRIDNGRIVGMLLATDIAPDDAPYPLEVEAFESGYAVGEHYTTLYGLVAGVRGCFAEHRWLTPHQNISLEYPAWEPLVVIDDEIYIHSGVLALLDMGFHPFRFQLLDEDGDVLDEHGDHMVVYDELPELSIPERIEIDLSTRQGGANYDVYYRKSDWPIGLEMEGPPFATLWETHRVSFRPGWEHVGEWSIRLTAVDNEGNPMEAEGVVVVLEPPRGCGCAGASAPAWLASPGWLAALLLRRRSMRSSRRRDAAV